MSADRFFSSGYMYYGAAWSITLAAVATMQMHLCWKHHFLGSLVLHLWDRVQWDPVLCFVLRLHQLVGFFCEGSLDGSIPASRGTSTLRRSCHVVFHRRGQPPGIG